MEIQLDIQQDFLRSKITAVGQVFIQTAVSLLGSLAVAAVTAESKIQGLLVQPMDSMGITMTNYSGQNMGAEKPDRIRYGVKRSIMITTCSCAVIGFAAPLIGRYASALFSDNRDPRLLALICRYLRVNGAFFFLLGILVIVRGSVQWMGYAPHAMVCANAFVPPFYRRILEKSERTISAQGFLFSVPGKGT